MTISKRFVSTPFAAGVVGSLPRPLMVREMLPEAPGPASGEAAHSLRMDASVNYAIAIQEQNPDERILAPDLWGYDV